MEKLSHKDLEALAGAVGELYTHTDFKSLPRAMVALQRRLVPCDISTYNEIDTRTNELRAVHDYPHDDAEKMFPQFMAHLDEYPLSRRYEATGDRTPMKMSDFLGDREFRRLALYNEFYRYFGIRYQIAYFLPRCSIDFPILMGLQRTHRDFTGRDRRLLNCLGPHLEQAWQNARALTLARRQAEGFSRALGNLRQGIAFLDRAGRITWMTDLARDWLQAYFPAERGAGGRLPEMLRGWLTRLAGATDGRAAEQAREPLVISRGDRRLRVRWVSEKTEDSWLVLSEEDESRSVAWLARLGLTAREAEVLHWMAEGKNNPEIGIILGSSPNTVRKHVEHILAKLVVETRAAAVRQVWDMRMAA
jgi:DNA-binding CsgD family transcriptional regulator